MTSPHPTDHTGVTVRRRTVLFAGATGIAATAGCLGALSSDSGPQDHTFTVSITRSNGELSGRVAEATDVEDVVQVAVGDSVTLEFVNETDAYVGVHDHATDTEAIVDPGGETTMTFDVSEAMVGRRNIEAWIADDTARAENGDTHGADATTIVVIEVRPQGS